MGNTDRGKEEAWKGPEGKNTSQTKAKRKKKMFFTDIDFTMTSEIFES